MFSGALKDVQPKGPFFIDTVGCGCALQEKLNSEAWRCIANVTQDAYDGDNGKWYYAVNQADPGSLQAPENSNSNPPDTATVYYIQNGNFSKISDTNPVDVNSNVQDIQDFACTGVNQTVASTQFYEQLADVSSGKDLPCWQPGTLPLPIQDVQSWDSIGCLPGFYCKLVLP